MSEYSVLRTADGTQQTGDRSDRKSTFFLLILLMPREIFGAPPQPAF